VTRFLPTRRATILGRWQMLRVRPSPRSRRAVVTTGIGTVIEGYDILLYGYLAGILAEQFFPAADPTAALLNTFAIFAVGSWPGPSAAWPSGTSATGSDGVRRWCRRSR
jgi:hypothetical protein